MVDTVDCVVIGAGVVGLAVARRFAQRGLETLVLEAQAETGTGTSSRNSEVIHAGIYYPAGSLKARLCRTGRTLLYQFAVAIAVLSTVSAASSLSPSRSTSGLRSNALRSPQVPMT